MDPSADDLVDRPERYFDYDTLTGELVPRTDIAGDARRKALNTIDGLGLNKTDLTNVRFRRVRRFLADLSMLPADEQRDFISYFTEQPVEHAGVTRMAVEQVQ